MKLDVARPAVPLPPAEDRKTAKRVSLDTLPHASELAAGTLVIVDDRSGGGGERSLVRSVLGALGRKKTVSRADRCTALVARGYVDVGAAVDPETDADLAWGRS